MPSTVKHYRCNGETADGMKKQNQRGKSKEITEPEEELKNSSIDEETAD